MAYTEGLVLISDMLPAIRERMLAAGWTESPTATFTSPSLATLKFSVGAVTAAGTYISTDIVSGSASGRNLYTNSTTTAAYVQLRSYVSATHVHLNVSSPLPGQIGYQGQTRSSITMTTITPYSPQVTFNANTHIAFIGCSASGATASQADMWVRNSATGGGGWEPSRLMTMKSAIISTAVADQPLYRAPVKTFWPYLVVGSVRGVIGTLDSVYLASESTADNEDNWTAENVRTSIAGATYRSEIPMRTDSTAGYTPFGMVGKVQGGPYILVKE